MFEYARITTIHDYLKARFPGALVSGFAAAIVRFGDAHAFEITDNGQCHTLTISHHFLSEHEGPVEEFLDRHDVARALVEIGHLCVTGAGRVEAADGGKGFPASAVSEAPGLGRMAS